jgi:hypothetical protein
MTTRLSPHFVELVYNAALKSFWRKEALRKFLRQSGITESFLATWAEGESKRDLLDRLFAELQRRSKGDAVIQAMARSLAAQESFPDLENWEDAREKIRDATAAVNRLRGAVRKLDQEVEGRQDREEARKRLRERQQEAARSRADLEKLSERLNGLSQRLGTQGAGYEFQSWFYDLAGFFEISHRRPYVHQGRQIDGSITITDTTYLVELKFTKEQADATDVDSILKKIRDKADNTMGVMVSISGFSKVAVQEASGPRTPLLLMDFRHLYYMLGGTMTLREVIERVRRHASQTGEAYLAPEDFGGL